MGSLGKIVAAAFIAFAVQSVASADDGNCPWWRPCGPGNSWGGNRGFAQGAYGADFRPACAQHDACLANGCNSRKSCDREFLNNMYSACECSDKPLLCRHKARMYYLGARLFGGAYR